MTRGRAGFESAATAGRRVRVAVVAPRSVPPVEGGAERHWASLVEGLEAAGFEAALEAHDAPEADLLEVLDSYRRFLALDLSSYDVVISGKYPSWMVRHPRHIRHLNHPLRGLYERYPGHLPEPTPDQLARVEAELRSGGPEGLLDWAIATLEQTPDLSFPGPLARAVVQGLDRDAAERIEIHATVSEHVAKRPGYLPDQVDVAVIPPLTDLVTGPPRPTGRHFLSYGRLSPVKRIDLAIRAFARSGLEDLELRIAGTGPEEPRLRELAARTPGVSLLGHCDDDELRNHLATCIAVIATPEDEDFGLVAAESLANGRPVITTSDSGGVAEQIEHGVTGLVTAPAVTLLARAVRRLGRDPQLADRLGRAGRDQLAGRTWQPMIRLVTDLADPRPPRPGLLMISTFPAEPVAGGGARRLRSMAAALQSTFDVTVMALTNRVQPGTVERRLLADGVRQVLVGRSKPHLRADNQMAALVGLPVDDVGCSVLHRSTPEWARTLDAELERSQAVLLAHPFLSTSLPSGLDLPIVYDGHNVEVELKAALLATRSGSGRLLEWCREAEQTAAQRADIVSATSRSDANRLDELYGGPTALVVPNGVDEHLLSVATRHERDDARHQLLADLGIAPDDARPVVLFVASNHPPNHQAADALAVLAGHHPELLVVLAGAHAERQRPDVHSFGRFGEATHRRLLWAADVAVNPVVFGSGTNLKLIEALAAGTPVVSTSVGARGIDHPERVLTVTSLPDLAAAIDATLTGSATADRIEAGRALAAEHTWRRTVAPLETALIDEVDLPLVG